MLILHNGKQAVFSEKFNHESLEQPRLFYLTGVPRTRKRLELATRNEIL